MKLIELDFYGSYVGDEINAIPEIAGIYCVYAADRVIGGKWGVRKNNRLLYIGKAGNLRERLLSHEKDEVFREELSHEEMRAYTITSISKVDVVRAEAALVHRHKPPLNTEWVNHFNFPATVIKCSGNIPYLESSFIEKKSDRSSKDEQLQQQTVYLPVDDLKKGKIAAAKSGITISKVLEVALKEWLDKNY